MEETSTTEQKELRPSRLIKNFHRTEIRENSFALRIVKTWNQSLLHQSPTHSKTDLTSTGQTRIYYKMTTGMQSPEWEMKLK